MLCLYKRKEFALPTIINNPQKDSSESNFSRTLAVVVIGIIVIGLIFIYFLPVFRDYFNGGRENPETTNSSTDINLDGTILTPSEDNLQ